MTLCTTCYGIKTIQCPVCLGRGKVNGIPCAACGSAGKIICPTCKGTGRK